MDHSELSQFINKAVKCKKFKDAFLFDEVLSNVFGISKFGLSAIGLWILDHRYGALVNFRLHQMFVWKHISNGNKIREMKGNPEVWNKRKKIQKYRFVARKPLLWKHIFLNTVYGYLSIFFGRLLMSVYILDISPFADIDKGFWGIFRNVAITAYTKIGKNAYIEANVTIGSDRGVIKDNVHIHTGAVIVGNIEIGDNAVIGANSLVTRSVPPNTTVLGIPAKVVFKKGVSNHG